MTQIAPDILLAHERAVMESDEDDEDEAEESLNGPGPYDASVDFWSLGVTIYEVSKAITLAVNSMADSSIHAKMLVGSLPFYADSIPETYERILQHEVQPSLGYLSRGALTLFFILQIHLDWEALRLDTAAKNLLQRWDQNSHHVGCQLTTIALQPYNQTGATFGQGKPRKTSLLR
jgi:serine/threonine protein kinase